jgi:beta-lactamase superfamily II metal-dependent hydrolase
MVRDRARVKRFLDDYGKVLAVSFFVIAIGATIFFLYSLTLPKKLHVTFFDVGQGDSILIQTPSGHEVLIDGGATSLVVKKLSKKMGYFDKHLDVMIATHDDADHITGLIPVLAHFEVDTIITSPLSGHTGVSAELTKHIDDEHADVHVARKGEVIDFGDGVVAHILYPSKNLHVKESETNDASVSLVITYGEESVLLTGDLPTTHEGELFGGALPRGITVYKAGHHGSKYSSGEQLLSYIRPEYAVISAGKDNKYGHPNPEALERLTTYSKEIISTIDKGTITFLLNGKSVDIETEK